tara:strand:- start:37 stop:459 length:423 start_codon:yes stop_codon:yes gene_type:complete
MSLVYIKDYLEELDKGISDKEWFLKDENKRLRGYLERSIKSFESKDKEIAELLQDRSHKRNKIEELKNSIAYLRKYIDLKEEYDKDYDFYYGNCCGMGDCSCEDAREYRDEDRIDLELKEKSLEYLKKIINMDKKDELER